MKNANKFNSSAEWWDSLDNEEKLHQVLNYCTVADISTQEFVLADIDRAWLLLKERHKEISDNIVS